MTFHELKWKTAEEFDTERYELREADIENTDRATELLGLPTQREIKAYYLKRVREVYADFDTLEELSPEEQKVVSDKLGEVVRELQQNLVLLEYKKDHIEEALPLILKGDFSRVNFKTLVPAYVDQAVINFTGQLYVCALELLLLQHDSNALLAFTRNQTLRKTSLNQKRLPTMTY